ncbi:MAG: hypothetical protein HDR48_02925 [Bacteroides sp.]|nr:hypothetical protein [Bacteroides sp.]MBD5418973.1 hypothetical protein [Bacteroides sp.]MDE7462649.1 phage holin family protein [Muribaculaceae bacterium]
MKDSIASLIGTIFDNGKKWIKLEIEYARLTMAEKLTVLLSTLILGAVAMLLGMVILLLLALALVDVFTMFMAKWLACLSVCGVILVIIAVIYLLRRPLLENPISRLISKLILDIKPEKENE